MYRCEAVSPEAFVQQLSCNLVNHGYWFYAAARVPPGKDVSAVDRKLIAGYGLDVSKWVQSRRKAKGLAKIAYLRHERFFVLLATQGEHVFFDREAVKDMRREPLVFAGYCIGAGKGSDGRYHASVRIDAGQFNDVRAHLLDLACRRSKENLVRVFNELRFEPYARVRRQLLRLLREVNEKRRTAGFEPLPSSCLTLRRYPIKVFRNGEAVAQLADGPL